MAIFPRIQSPCPYRSQLAAVMDGNFCRMCSRQVVDLSAMDDSERVAFLKGCSGAVCVSYKLPVGRAMAAALTVAAVTMPAAAFAQDAQQMEEIVIGGIKDPANVEYIQDAGDAAIPELPVVYEDKTDAKGGMIAATTDQSGRPN